MSSLNVKGKRFTWRTSFNYTSSKNKLAEFPDFKGSGYDNTLIIGQPLNIIKTFHFIGVNSQTGIYEFSDSKGGVTTRPDTAMTITKQSLINVNPKFYGGFGNSFRFNNFELDVFFHFVKQTGQGFLVNPNFTPPGRFSPTANQPAYVLERWQKPGDGGVIQRYSTSTSNAVAIGYRNMLQSDLSYGDASFVRLKTLSLSYLLPDRVKERLHLQNARLYLNAQNLFTITRYKGFDPENQSVTSLPPLRVIVAGIQLTF
jgi:hypothetical protein